MRLVLMGDFHYSRMEDGAEEMKEARDRAYSVMLDTFVNTDGQFHISLGDLTHDGFPEEFGYVFDRIEGGQCNFIHVLGNHDTHSIPKADILAITGQQRYRSIELDEAMLIFLDSTKEMNKSDWGGEIDEEQLEWLEARLVESGEKPVFVFAHHPVYDTTACSTMEKLSIHPDIDMKAVLNKKQGFGFYFCGHNHVNSIVRQDGWHYIQTAACLDIPAFRIVELEDDQVTTDLVTIDHANLTEYITSFNTKMKGFTPVLEARGEAVDCSLSVKINDIGTISR
ncbi:metallophosphoesterase family protein [Paenibacillus radicis (ex Xue et al. 2023)]|uniref:Metallophosphoesterase n=1 Tax=Paenibacillus radicis (ex Xue et al. 2023) TaxID=2972489 RepID=A0ABT1YM71_9BACL|nr:metallophosphoesterase [Paenibacillus radicis (ex Xue et al. 2023)]MCR8634266.1 metallophosphoesterase [Paenibacillus radicis (ex Xue et al. 2023)]